MTSTYGLIVIEGSFLWNMIIGPSFASTPFYFFLEDAALSQGTLFLGTFFLTYCSFLFLLQSNIALDEGRCFSVNLRFTN